MIIGFLGKGGSGKSTISTKFAKYFHKKGHRVLAIDADHNMDMSFNLGAPENMNYIGTETVYELYKHINKEDEKIQNILENAQGALFNLTEKDSYTKKHTAISKSGIEIMSAGPQNNRVFSGESCSHSLASPLKIYLPLLKINENEIVVVDEKASVDAVTTGIPCGFHLAVIVIENKLHSIKAGKQIAEALDFFQVPYIFIGNKLKDEKEKVDLKKEVEIFAYIELNTEENNTKKDGDTFEKIHQYCKKNMENGDKRLERALGRFKKQIV